MIRFYKYTLLCALLALSTLLLLQPATAQTLFRETFENTDGSDWVPDNADQIWEIADFPGSGSGLKNTVEGCGISGNTPLPGVTNFSDGVVQLDMSWEDDDSWGVIIRQTAPDAGYLIVFGYNETPSIIIALLDDGCAETGNCLDQVNCENGGNELIQVDHGLGADLTQDLTVAYLGRVEARGDTIRVWYGPRDDFPNPFAADLGVPPTLEFQDGTHSGPGSVGVWHESQGGSMIDNVWVSGPVSVEPQGKLAAVWASVKTSY